MTVLAQKPTFNTASASDVRELTANVTCHLLDNGAPGSMVAQMVSRVRACDDEWDAVATLLEYCDLRFHNEPIGPRPILEPRE